MRLNGRVDPRAAPARIARPGAARWATAATGGVCSARRSTTTRPQCRRKHRSVPNASSSFFSLPTSALKTNCEARRGRLSAYVEPQRAAAAAETGLRGAVGCARVQREGRNHPGKRALHWPHLLRCCAWVGAETAAPELFRRNGNGRARGPARAVGGDGGDDEEDELRLDQGTEPTQAASHPCVLAQPEQHQRHSTCCGT